MIVTFIKEASNIVGGSVYLKAMKNLSSGYFFVLLCFAKLTDKTLVADISLVPYSDMLLAYNPSQTTIYIILNRPRDSELTILSLSKQYNLNKVMWCGYFSNQ